MERIEAAEAFVQNLRVAVPKTRPAFEKQIEAAAFRALEFTIFEIGVGSAQRPGDWIEFCWGDYDGTSLRLRQR